MWEFYGYSIIAAAWFDRGILRLTPSRPPLSVGNPIKIWAFDLGMSLIAKILSGLWA